MERLALLGPLGFYTPSHRIARDPFLKHRERRMSIDKPSLLLLIIAQPASLQPSPHDVFNSRLLRAHTHTTPSWLIPAVTVSPPLDTRLRDEPLAFISIFRRVDSPPSALGPGPPFPNLHSNRRHRWLGTLSHPHKPVHADQKGSTCRFIAQRECHWQSSAGGGGGGRRITIS